MFNISWRSTTVLDVRSYLESIDAADPLEQWRARKHLYLTVFLEQLKVSLDASAVDEWPRIATLLAAFNTQYGSVNKWTQKFVQFIASSAAHTEPGFVWLLCDGQRMEFQFTPRFEALNLGKGRGVVLVVDIWSHLLFADFVRGRRAKIAEWDNVRRRKYRTHEVVGQAIDVEHIGTSEQKAFNFARSRVELLGYYIDAVIQNLDWVTVSRRWESQCVENSKENDQRTESEVQVHNEGMDTTAVHQEL